jgi:creatinine amidohydrolase/Fe(II)-dependent formamide hydrolase-like protein
VIGCRRWLPCAALLCLALGARAESAAGEGHGSVFLEELTWTELRDAVRSGKTVALIPIGGTEQSGPAIALGKHNTRVRYLAGRIAHELGDAIVAPVVAYVPEGQIDPATSHMRFPGTLSIPEEVFEKTVEFAARSLRAHGFRDIVLLGDHGGYVRNLDRVAQRLNREWAATGTRVHHPREYYEAAGAGFAKILRERGYRDDEIGTHAALADTSLMLAIDPSLVRPDVLASGTPLGSAQGIYGGDPRRASADLGRAGVDHIVDRTVAAIRLQVSHAAPNSNLEKPR